MLALATEVRSKIQTGQIWRTTKFTINFPLLIMSVML